MNPLISSCPVCHSPLVIKRLVCPACDTAIEGSFYPPNGAHTSAEGSMFSPEQLEKLAPFAKLSSEQLDFVVTFLRCEGRFNRLEEEMNLSYPTLRNRFDEIVRALGYEPDRQPPPPGIHADERKRILEDLEMGRITPQEAKRQLRELGDSLKESIRRSIRDSLRGI